jgi:hypothetical protein
MWASEVMLRGFDRVEDVQFRRYVGLVNTAQSRFEVYHNGELLLYVRDPKFGRCKPYVHICRRRFTRSVVEFINEFLGGIGCVNKFTVIGSKLGAAGERKIEPKYCITWPTNL